MRLNEPRNRYLKILEIIIKLHYDETNTNSNRAHGLNSMLVPARREDATSHDPEKREKPLDPPAPPPCPVSDKRWTTGRTANVTAVKRMKIQCSALASLRDRITWRALRHILKKLPELRRSS